VLLELAPELSGGVTAHVPTGLEQRWRTRQGTSGVHEVHRVGAPALGVPAEPRRVGGLGVLDPSLLLHGAHASTPVLAGKALVGQGQVLEACGLQPGGLNCLSRS